VATETQEPNLTQPELPSQGVGTTLREARQKLGQELAFVASQLRIRQPFLAAIENNRPQDLPGSAYAVGFVRSYAEYLGLDGNEMVRRFKQESGGGFTKRAELSFPSASSEGNFPAGGVLIGAVALAAVVYGVWYWSSHDSSSVAESVPALPDRLAAMIHKPVGNGGEVTPVASSTAPAAQPVAEPAPVIPSQPVASAPHEDVVPPSDGEADKEKAAPVVAPVITPAVVTPAVVAPAPAPVLAAPAPVAPAPVVAAPAPAPAPQAVPAAKLGGKADEPVTLPENASRVILKASEDCWIRIRDANGTVIHSGILRKGTAFHVTQRPGQTLTAGNAGALTVLVDGKSLPALGETGKVAKGVPLDPEKLDKLPPAPAAAPAAEPAAEDAKPANQ